MAFPMRTFRPVSNLKTTRRPLSPNFINIHNQTVDSLQTTSSTGNKNCSSMWILRLKIVVGIFRHVFMTTDCGLSFKSFNLSDIVPSLIEFDKRRENVFLIHDLESIDKRLYVTKDFGQSFAPVQDYVKTFALKYHANETELFVQVKVLN